MYKSNEKDLKYPVLQIDINKIYENAKKMVDLCNESGINISGVVKGINGIPKVVEQFVNAGCKYIAHSRMDQIITLKEYGIKTPMMLIRIPMFSEIDQLVKYVEVSLNSEIETLNRIEKECRLQNRKHGVVLMFDLGDLREGFIDEEEFIKSALHVETKLKNVELYGIGTNLGCYGSIRPTEKNLKRLCGISQKIEKIIGRELEIISGGETTSIPLIIDGKMPNKINHLRIGEGILLGRDLQDFWGYDMNHMHQDTFVLKAQVVEIKDKPSYPIGEIFIDAFGNRQSYEDIGVRKRALLAVGKQDFVFHDQLIPKNDGVKIMGGSSDHLIVDIEECREKIEVGDVLDFQMYYGPMLYLSASKSVTKVYI